MIHNNTGSDNRIFSIVPDTINTFLNNCSFSILIDLDTENFSINAFTKCSKDRFLNYGVCNEIDNIVENATVVDYDLLSIPFININEAKESLSEVTYGYIDKKGRYYLSGMDINNIIWS